MAAKARISEERKMWRKECPVGFYAKPTMGADGSSDLFNWEAGIPGRAGTAWEGGQYKCKVRFPKDYPLKAPTVTFTPPIFHPNVYEDGEVCLSLLNDQPGGAWKPGISVTQILKGLQDLLDDPNTKSPANIPAYMMFDHERTQYEKRIKLQATKFAKS